MKKKGIIITIAIILAIVMIGLTIYLIKINTKKTITCTYTVKNITHQYISKRIVEYNYKKIIVSHQYVDINEYYLNEDYQVAKNKNKDLKNMTFNDNLKQMIETYEKTKPLDENGKQMTITYDEYINYMKNAGYTCK